MRLMSCSMSPECSLVDAAHAQQVFDQLPASLQIPSLSPAYVCADAARDPSLSPIFMLWRDGAGVLMHSLHEARIPERDEFDWQSAYNYGGPLAHGLEESSVTEGWSGFAGIALERRVVVEFVRFHPVLENERLYRGTVNEDRAVVMLDLTAADLVQSYSGRARTAIRKALNSGLTLAWVTQSDSRSLFPDFYREGMRRMGASDFYRFSDEYFARVLALPCARVLAVMREDTPVSMGLFLLGPAIAEYHLSATSLEGRATAATNLLLHGAAQFAQQRGLIGLYLGGGTNLAMDNPLLVFKSSFAAPRLKFRTGFRVYDEDTYESLRVAGQPRAGRVLFYRG
jgi:hypothetical protein